MWYVLYLLQYFIFCRNNEKELKKKNTRKSEYTSQNTQRQSLWDWILFKFDRSHSSAPLETPPLLSPMKPQSHDGVQKAPLMLLWVIHGGRGSLKAQAPDFGSGDGNRWLAVVLPSRRLLLSRQNGWTDNVALLMILSLMRDGSGGSGRKCVLLSRKVFLFVE